MHGLMYIKFTKHCCNGNVTMSSVYCVVVVAVNNKYKNIDCCAEVLLLHIYVALNYETNLDLNGKLQLFLYDFNQI